MAAPGVGLGAGIGMGYAMGHYARWLTKGAVRIEAAGASPLVQITAFRDGARKRLVLVVVNNADEPATLNAALANLSVAGTVEGEQSTAHDYWRKLAPVPAAAADRLRLDVPSLSVTTFSASLTPAAP